MTGLLASNTPSSSTAIKGLCTSNQLPRNRSFITAHGINTFAPAKQDQLDRLLEKNADGSLLPAERAELESLVAEAERLMIDNARVLADFARDHTPQPPLPAMPVTVWVTPQQADP